MRLANFPSEGCHVRSLPLRMIQSDAPTSGAAGEHTARAGALEQFELEVRLGSAKWMVMVSDLTSYEGFCRAVLDAGVKACDKRSGPLVCNTDRMIFLGVTASRQACHQVDKSLWVPDEVCPHCSWKRQTANTARPHLPWSAGGTTVGLQTASIPRIKIDAKRWTRTKILWACLSVSLILDYPAGATKQLDVCLSPVLPSENVSSTIMRSPGFQILDPHHLVVCLTLKAMCLRMATFPAYGCTFWNASNPVDNQEALKHLLIDVPCGDNIVEAVKLFAPTLQGCLPQDLAAEARSAEAATSMREIKGTDIASCLKAALFLFSDENASLLETFSNCYKPVCPVPFALLPDRFKAVGHLMCGFKFHASLGPQDAGPSLTCGSQLRFTSFLLAMPKPERSASISDDYIEAHFASLGCDVLVFFEQTVGVCMERFSANAGRFDVVIPGPSFFNITSVHRTRGLTVLSVKQVPAAFTYDVDDLYPQQTHTPTITSLNAMAHEMRKKHYDQSHASMDSSLPLSFQLHLTTKCVGTGSVGKVRVLVDTTTNTKYAEKQGVCGELSTINKEIDTISRLTHPNIVKYMGWMLCAEWSRESTLIVMELCNGGSLNHLFRVLGKLPVEMLRLAHLSQPHPILTPSEVYNLISTMGSDIKHLASPGTHPNKQTSELPTVSELIHQAQAAVDCNQLKSAVDCLRSALQIDSTCVAAYVLLGFVHQFCETPPQSKFAMQCYGSELKTHPKHTRSMLCLGELYRANFDAPEQAVSLFKRCLDVDPHNVDAMLCLLEVYNNYYKDTAEAFHWYKMALEHNPDELLHKTTGYGQTLLHSFPELWIVWGVENARIIYELALKHDPNHTASLYGLGAIQTYAPDNGGHPSAEQINGAKTRFMQALETDQNHLHSLHSLGVLYMMYGDQLDDAPKPFDTEQQLDTVRMYFDRALKVDPRHFNSLHALGMVYSGLRKDPDKALEYLLRALEVQPGNSGTLNAIGELYRVDFNQPIKAAEFFTAALCSDPYDTESLDCLALLKDSDARVLLSMPTGTPCDPKVHDPRRPSGETQSARICKNRKE
eukprot:gene9827-33_t